MAIVVPIIVSLLSGFLLGLIPGSYEYLHWHAWFVIPVSGFVIGMALGWLQFKLGYVVDVRVAGFPMVVMAGIASLAYFGSDYGIHMRVSSATVSGDSGFLPWDVIDMVEERAEQAFEAVLESTGKAREVHETYAQYVFITDQGACFIGALLVYMFLGRLHPYCRRCQRFMRRDKRLLIRLTPHDQAQIMEILRAITRNLDAKEYLALRATLKRLSVRHKDKVGTLKISADHRFCKGCKSATFVGRIFQLGKKGWAELHQLQFYLTSKRGEFRRML